MLDREMGIICFFQHENLLFLSSEEKPRTQNYRYVGNACEMKHVNQSIKECWASRFYQENIWNHWAEYISNAEWSMINVALQHDIEEIVFWTLFAMFVSAIATIN